MPTKTEELGMTRNQRRWIAVLLGAFLMAGADIAVQEGRGATALINDKKVQVVLTSVTKGASLKSPPRDQDQAGEVTPTL